MRWFPALFLAAMLAPYLATGYYQDDSLNYRLPEHLASHGLTVLDFVAAQTRHWMFEAGRLFPAGTAWSYSFWAAAPGLTAYRLMQVSLVALNWFLWRRLLLGFGSGERIAALSGAWVLVFFQLRDSHDPIASYAALLQLSLAFGQGAILLLLRHRRGGRRAPLAGSWFCYALGLLFYETGICFAPVLAWLAWRPGPGDARAPSRARRLGHLAITAAYLAAVTGLRARSALTYDGTRVALTGNFFRALFNQLSGALPTVYALFGRADLFVGADLGSARFWSPAAFAVAALGGATYLAAWRRPPAPSAPGPARTPLLLLAFSLWVIPSVLVALSPKYQADLHRPGLAYLPVYLSYFGVSLLAALALAGGRRPRFQAAAFALLAFFAFSANRVAAERLNERRGGPRSAFAWVVE